MGKRQTFSIAFTEAAAKADIGADGLLVRSIPGGNIAASGVVVSLLSKPDALKAAAVLRSARSLSLQHFGPLLYAGRLA